jgi:hypothetical protein
VAAVNRSVADTKRTISTLRRDDTPGEVISYIQAACQVCRGCKFNLNSKL